MSGINSDSAVVNQGGVPLVFAAALADFPAAGVPFRIGFRTDVPYGVYMDTGSAFVLVAQPAASAGVITGSGTAGKIPLFTAVAVIADSIISQTPGLLEVAGSMNLTGAINSILGNFSDTQAVTAPLSARNNGAGVIVQFLNVTGGVSNINNSGMLQLAAGLSTQFYKADGTLDSNTYLTTTGTGTGLTDVVHIAGVENVTGAKTFSNALKITGLGSLAGLGAEVVYTSSIGFFQTFDRTGLVYLPTVLAGSTVQLRIGAVSALSIDAARDILIANLAGTGSRMVVASASGTLSASLIVTDGTYTPTVTNVINTAARSGSVWQYSRVGSVVTMSGRLYITPTAAGAITIVRLTIPVAATFALAANAGGCGVCANVSGTPMAGEFYATSNTLEFAFQSTVNVALDFSCNLTYYIP